MDQPLLPLPILTHVLHVPLFKGGYILEITLKLKKNAFSSWREGKVKNRSGLEGPNSR
jgi:hypothetical protein